MPINIRPNNKPSPKIIHVDDPGDLEVDQPQRRRINRDHRISHEGFEVISVEVLKLDPKRAKTHPESQIAELARSIERFGFNDPIEIDQNNTIVAGVGRYLAAKHLGMTEVPVVRYSHLSEVEKRAYRIASNKIAEQSLWNFTVLADDFELFTNCEVDIDPRDTGFTTVEIDQISYDLDAQSHADPADNFSEVVAGQQPITRPGDKWILGKHVLLCADALERDNFGKLLGSDRANIVFTDAPFNVPNQGHVSKREGVREFAMGHGEMTSAEFIRFQETVCAHLRDHMEPGAVAYMCMDHRHLLELRLAADRVFGAHKNMCVWLKPNAGMGSFYRSQHELIMVYAAPGRVKNNFGLGGTGRHRSNVWTYPGLSSFGRDRDETLAMHPTVKPVAMIADALRDCSDRGDIVLDPFGGSGSTLIAAERTGRRARLMEIDPLYCDCIIRRWQKLTGNAARLADSNETFGEAEVRRGAGQ